jgi:hypothetical protein
MLIESDCRRSELVEVHLNILNIEREGPDAQDATMTYNAIGSREVDILEDVRCVTFPLNDLFKLGFPSFLDEDGFTW